MVNLSQVHEDVKFLNYLIYELQIDTKNSKFVDDVNSLVKPPQNHRKLSKQPQILMGQQLFNDITNIEL